MLILCYAHVNLGLPSSVQGRNMVRLLILSSLFAVAFPMCAQDLMARSFHPNGRVQGTRYSDGNSAYFVEYHTNGRVAAMGAYREGRRHGTWKRFDEHGVMRSKAEFNRGERCGTWEFRDGRNALQGTLRYAEGRLASGTLHDAGGHLIAGRTF